MRSLLLLLVFWCTTTLHAQPSQTNVQVIVAPDRDNWTYKVGENSKFNITVLRYGNPVKNVTIQYELGPEKLTPTKKETKVLTDGKLTVEGGTMKQGGFIRCIATTTIDGVTYRGFATAGFDPDKIQPTIPDPSDFDTFWNTAKEQLAKIPLDAQMTLLPERCTEKVNVYHVSLQNFPDNNARVYGILCMPKKEGKYPALLHVPGAGARPYNGDIANAEQGIITFQIGIHGVPVIMEPSIYTNMMAANLRQYFTYNMDDRDRFYFKRVYLGCVRANDFLVSLPQYDGQTLAVTGGSQGGALSITTAALDSRVKWLAALYPALSDVTGYLHGRAGGWPHYFGDLHKNYSNTKEKLATLSYYDVVNFAKRLKVPGFYSWGFNDETCPPTSMYAFYNVTTAPKELFLTYDSGHWPYPEQRTKLNDWLLNKLLNK